MEPLIANPIDQRRFVQNPRLVRVVLLLGLLLSLLGAVLARQAQGQRTEGRFQVEAKAAQGNLGDHLKAHSQVMHGLRGLARAMGRLDRESFRNYLSAQELGSHRGGLLAISFGVRVDQEHRQAFEARMQAELDGLGRPFGIKPPGVRDDYFVVIYGEPEEANHSAIGFDALSIPGQRASLDLAVDSGAMVASAPMKVLQYDGPDPCLVMRLPVFHAAMPTGTPEQRRRALYGCINAVFRAQDLIQASLGAETLRKMEVWIEDVGPLAPAPGAPTLPLTVYGQPFPRHDRLASFLKSHHETRQDLPVGGRRWRVHFRARPEFGDDQGWALPLGVFGGGFLVTLLLSGLLESLNQTGQRAKQLAWRMTEQLQQNEARLMAIAQAVPDLLLVLDEDGRYLEIHGRQEDLLAAPKAVLMGRTVPEMLPEEVARICMEAIGATLDSHELQTITYELTTPAGRCTFEARLVEMGTPLANKRCVVMVTRDITERSRAEENLRMAQKLESLGVLAGGIAHDFNNLLTAILGNLNLAQMHVPDASPAGPLLQRVETTVLRAAELAHQMLAYSGRGTFTVDHLDLNQVVGEMTELLAVSIAKKVTLAFNLAEALPPILADGVQIQQVVMNLVTNASESMEDRTGTIAITTGTQLLDEAFVEANLPTQRLEPGPYVTLEVSDTGCGMDPETLSRIFDPFFTTKSTGRGLGLSAMLGILRGHGAGIWIRSEPGAGSTFRVLFPAADRASGNHQPAAQEPPKAQDLGGTILVVDDEPVVRATAMGIVENLGMKALEAGDGVEALDLFLRHRDEIDLVLMDITMPRMDGNEAFLAIRELAPRLPVILCSGFTILEVVQPPPGTRPADFVQKPYRVADLKKAMQRALQGPFLLERGGK